MVDVLADPTERVRRILEQQFPGASVTVGRFHGAEKVNGQILWEGFEGADSVDRQEAIYKALRDALGEDAKGVSIILAYTPREWEIMGEE